jgi:hypothetical protein
MRDAGFEKARAFSDETETFPEAERALLRVNVNQGAVGRFGLHAVYEGLPDGAPAMGKADGHALELPALGGGPSPRRGYRLAINAHEEVLASVVYLVQLELGRDRLLLHEDSPPNRTAEGAIGRRESTRNDQGHAQPE